MDQNNLYQVYFFERNNDRNKALSLQTAGTGRGIIASVWCRQRPAFSLDINESKMLFKVL
jgi:hypothetical protein